MKAGLVLKLAAGSIAASGLFALAAASSATATDFCDDLSNPACPSGATFQPNIVTAMQSNGNDGIPDRVFLSAGTKPTPTNFAPSSGGLDPLEVIGAGRTSTVLTSTASGINGNIYVVDLSNMPGRKVTLRDLAIKVPASFPDGSPGWGSALQESGDVFERVDFTSANPPNPASYQGSAAVGNALNGGTFNDIKMYGTAGGGFGQAFSKGTFSPGDILEITDSDIRDVQSGINDTVPGTGQKLPVAITRSHFIANSTALGVYNTSTTVDNSLIEGGALTPIYVQTIAGSSSPASLLMRNSTVVSATGAPVGISVGASTTASGNASAVVVDSILNGFTNSWSTFAGTGGNGDANFEIRYSNYATPPTASGDGITVATLGNQSTDPKFLGPGNYHLADDSPSIDAGDPAPPVLTDDLEKNVRPLDGNGDGVAVRDQGAYEHAAKVITPPGDTTAPVLSKLKVKVTRKTVKVSYVLSEAASVRFTFAPKPKKKRKTVTVTRKSKAGANSFVIKRRRLKTGRYRLSASATDAAGNRLKKPSTIPMKLRRPGK